MAQPRINLNDFKASGVYTLENDQSENIVLPLTTGRLIVGSSRVGPYNTVVLINDVRSRSAVYGEIDPKLEKAGSFFHRSIDIALREGPVYALNVIPLDPESDSETSLDKAFFATFNTESGANNDLDISKYAATVEYFNRRRLWFADTNQLNNIKNLELGDNPLDPNFGQNTEISNKILSFANLGTSNCTVWVRKADVRGFDLTAKEWFSSIAGQEVEFPSFVHNDDLISDYFVEAIVISGDWSNYIKLASDPVYRQFFDRTGLIASKSAEFFALREIRVINRTIGCLIPDFKDQRGQTVSIDRLFNRAFPTTGLICALDVRKLDLMDLTNSTLLESDVETHRVDIVGHGYDDLNSGNVYSADDGGATAESDGATAADPTPLIDVLSYMRPADASLVYRITNDFAQVSGEVSEANLAAGTSTTGNPVAIGETYVITPAVGDTYVVAMQGSKLYDTYVNGFLKTGDKTLDGNLVENYIRVIDNFSVVPSSGPSIPLKYIKLQFFQDIGLTNQVPVTSSDIAYDSVITGPGIYYIQITLASGANYKRTFDLTDTTYFTSYSIQQPNQLVLEINPLNQATVDEFIKVGQYIKAQTTSGRTRLLKILTITKPAPSLSSPTVDVYTVTVMSPSTDEIIGIDTTSSTIQVYKGVNNFATSLKGQYLKGFKIRDESLPNSTSARQDVILSYLYSYTSIPQALASRELIDFRYIVDTYEGQISQSSKYYITKLAALHGKALAFVNSPSAQQFERSVDPSFIDTTTRLLSAELISTGGNVALNPSFLYKFGEDSIKGVPLTSYMYPCFPNLIIRSGTKNISVPLAPYISNKFVQKFKNGDSFAIVGGGRKGAINDPEVVGIEYELTDEDRGFLEPAGHNLVVSRRGFGNIILSNNTAYQRVNSALNNAHVRDNLSTIERDLEKILFNFLFDYNDEIVRLRVKTIVENYMDAVVAARGVSTYSVTFDTSNNTGEVISANTAIIDLKVDFLRGIHKFINRITITRVGGALSSEQAGFIPSF